MENMYTALIETMIKKGIKENSTVEETANNFSSNNIKRVIITPDFIGVNYHIGESRYKVLKAEDKRKIMQNCKEPKYINCLYGLTKPFVCGNIETILVFTQSINDAQFLLSEKDFDIRGKYSNDSVIRLYNQTDVSGTLKRELINHYGKFLRKLPPDDVQALKNIEITGDINHNYEVFDSICLDENIRKGYRNYTEEVIDKLVQPKLEATQYDLRKAIKGFPRFRGLYVYNTALGMPEFQKLLNGEGEEEPEYPILTKLENNPKWYYRYRCKEQSNIYGEIDTQIAKKLDKMKEEKSEAKPEKREKKPEEQEKDYIETYYEKLEKLIERKGFNSLKPYMQYKKLSENRTYNNLLGFYLGNLVSLYEQSPYLVKTIYKNKSLRILNVKGFNEQLGKLKESIDIKFTDNEKIACNHICAMIERVFI